MPHGLADIRSISLEHSVISRMDREKIGRNVDPRSLIEEIKLFVNEYVSLREVEKKFLMESGQPYSGMNLRQKVLLQAPESAPYSTTRYVGGAKERARERLEQGVADENDMAIVQGHKCAYCGGDRSGASRARGVESTYCSRECSDQGRLKRGGMYSSTQIRAQLFALEGGICRLCGINAYALFSRISALEPAERLNALCNAHWKLPKSAKALERLLQDPKEGDFWNADHIKAVAEGGGGCNIDNLRTLCVPCHAGKLLRV